VVVVWCIFQLLVTVTDMHGLGLKVENASETQETKNGISSVDKRKFNLNELRHIAVNFAISCEKGYRGDFDSWFSGVSGEWREIANRK